MTNKSSKITKKNWHCKWIHVANASHFDCVTKNIAIKRRQSKFHQYEQKKFHYFDAFHFREVGGSRLLPILMKIWLSTFFLPVFEQVSLSRVRSRWLIEINLDNFENTSRATHTIWGCRAFCWKRLWVKGYLQHEYNNNDDDKKQLSKRMQCEWTKGKIYMIVFIVDTKSASKKVKWKINAYDCSVSRARAFSRDTNVISKWANNNNSAWGVSNESTLENNNAKSSVNRD